MDKQKRIFRWINGANRVLIPMCSIFFFKP